MKHSRSIIQKTVSKQENAELQQHAYATWFNYN